MAGHYRKKQNSLTSRSVDLLLNDLFNKHGVKMNKPKLGMREKQELKNLLRDLQNNVQNLTKKVTK